MNQPAEVPLFEKSPWPVYDYETLEDQIEVLYKFIDCHGTYFDHYKVGRVDDHLIIYKRIFYNPDNRYLYSQKEFPLSVGQWFVDALEQKFWRPKSEGGLGPWAGLVEYVDGEELGTDRGMAYGGPGIGGYNITNLSREAHPFPPDDHFPKGPVYLQMHDFLLRDVGLYGFFNDLKQWYLHEQATGEKKPLYPKVKPLGRIELFGHLPKFPEAAILLAQFPNDERPDVTDYWMEYGHFLVILSVGEHYFNQVEIPLGLAGWVVRTIYHQFISPSKVTAPKTSIARFAQTAEMYDEQIRVTHGLGQYPVERTRFRLMNLSRSSYTDALMVQNFDIFYGYFKRNDIYGLLVHFNE